MLTNRPRSFRHTSLIKTGMSDCHKLIASLFRALFKSISAKTIEYRNYSKFNPEVFIHELEQELNKDIIYNSQDKQYDLLNQVWNDESGWGWECGESGWECKKSAWEREE